MNYIPIGLPLFVALWLAFLALVALFQIGILGYVFESLGINRRYLFTLLVFCLLGSYINIPVLQLPGEQVYSGQLVNFYGVGYVIPVVIDRPGPVIAVNLGGAVLPVLLSIYLIVKNGLYRQSLIAVGFVTLVIHLLARPVPGVGIAVPIFIPPLITALVALALAPWQAAPLAYIAGSLGTLLGADLLNLGKIQGLGAPVASIGGAGKFDGIFLTGLVAVLFAAVFGTVRRLRQSSHSPAERPFMW